PEHVPAGVRIATPITNITIAQTILDLLWGQNGQTFTGPPLSAIWKNPETTFPAPVSTLAEINNIVREDAAENSQPTAKSGPMKSVITSQWHLIIHKNFGSQLYDWKQDPKELNNLTNTPEGRMAAQTLGSQLADVLAGNTEQTNQQSRLAS